VAASKALAALAIVVAGAVAAFAVYTFGWRDDDEDDGPETTLAASTTPRVYTLRRGDVVRVPGAATRCVASAEAGIPNLFCRRVPEGSHQIVLYADRIVVFKNGEPDDPAFSTRWRP
jgi:hypothetical protein